MQKAQGTLTSKNTTSLNPYASPCHLVMECRMLLGVHPPGSHVKLAHMMPLVLWSFSLVLLETGMFMIQSEFSTPQYFSIFHLPNKYHSVVGFWTTTRQYSDPAVKSGAIMISYFAQRIRTKSRSSSELSILM